MANKLTKYFGPSTLITAAFIGPGTITVCTLAGVKSGFSLLWAMVFSIITTIVLQEMAARLGLVTQHGLGHAIRTFGKNGWKKYFMILLVISAILIGNTAYEAGNLSGAILGGELFYINQKMWAIFFGIVAYAVLRVGKYKVLEKFLTILVILMSISFLITAIMLAPSFSQIIAGFIPSRLDVGELLLVMGIVGTTVVPYNLFLHASLVSQKYKDPKSLSDLRIENAVSIILGGVISMLVIIVAASNPNNNQEINNAQDLALQLQPVLGNSAKYLMGFGLIAAGLSSAITAPLAAALAAKGLFGWNTKEDDYKYRIVWMTVLIVGILFALSGYKPIKIIQFAQIANAILLPLIASYLLYLSNQKQLMHKYVNSKLTNALGLFVICITLLLSIKTLNSFFHIL